MSIEGNNLFDTEIYSVNIEKDTLLLSPHTLDYIYESTPTGDVIGVYFKDPRAGACFLALTPAAAQHVAAHLSAMVADLPRLRREWDERSAD
jgi:hypothetical protein